MSPLLRGPNPWPTLDQRLGQLRRTVQEEASAWQLWMNLDSSAHRHLGGDFEAAYHKDGRTLGMWSTLYGTTHRRAILEVAEQIELISQNEYGRMLSFIGEDADDLEHRVGRAATMHRLVLVESRKEIYFDGVKIPLFWRDHRAKWAFIKILVYYAPKRRPVQRVDVSDRSRDPKYLAKLLSDLSCLPDVPPELIRLIVPAGEGNYLLQLGASEICVITE